MLINIRDAAELLCVSTKTIYRWIASGSLPHVKVGNQYRFSRGELLAWAASFGRTVRPDSIQEPEAADEPLPTLQDALKEGGIFYRIHGSNPQEVIEEIVSAMNVPPGVERTYLSAALRARETLASTAIGEGVAVPHMRHPLPHMAHASLTLAFLAAPVEWMAIDKTPVNVVFVQISPTLRSHLHLLSHLSFVLKDRRWCRLLKNEASRKEIMKGLARAEKRLAHQPIGSASSAV